jgi:hypothetical protein
VEPNVTGSLVLGGYDASRCLTTPIISSSLTVELLDIALNVSSGGFAYTNASSGYLPGLLRANGSSVSSVNVYPRPGVPYLYLPQDTCDAIAAHLPVTYNSDFGLYFWNTDQPTYQHIIQSPHYLAFTFASESGQNSTIKVPFALLNLTLSSPVISSATQYFPCSPFQPADTGYTLGNAFLQAAFLAQNWQTNKLFLAQAPGPDFLSLNVQKIAYTDTTLTAAKNPPDFETTWATTLNALPGNMNSSSTTNASPGRGDAPSKISTGALAGIVVGAIAGMALVLGLVIFLRRRRNTKARASAPGNARYQDQAPAFSSESPYYSQKSTVPYVVDREVARHEVEAKQAAMELDGAQEVGELAGDTPRVDRKR